MNDPRTAGEVLFLELLNDCRDGLLELQQRWDDALTLEPFRPLEQYVEGRLAVAVNLQFGVAGDQSKCAQPFHGDAREVKDVLVLVFSPDIAQFRDRYGWDEQDVFVQNVQVVQGPKGVIPSV